MSPEKKYNPIKMIHGVGVGSPKGPCPFGEGIWSAGDHPFQRGDHVMHLQGKRPDTPPSALEGGTVLPP